MRNHPMAENVKGIPQEDQVWVVRDSNCGNGNDDPGVVLGVYWSQDDAAKAAQEFTDRGTPRDGCYAVDIEGPFSIN